MERQYDHQGPEMSTTRSTRGERGASLVEFALVAPILLILLFGAFELARLGYAFSEVRTAAREGARYATVVGDADGNGTPNFVDCAAIETAALDLVQVEAVTAADVDIVYTTPSGTTADCQGGTPPDGYSVELESGTEVSVTVHAEFDSVVPLLEGFFEGISMDNTQVRTVNYGLLGS